MSALRQVLVVDDDAAVREALVQTLDLHDLEPLEAGSFVAAKDHLTRDFAGVVLSDIRMPGRDGFHLLGHAQAADAELPVVLLTGEGDIPMAVEAMGQGAFSFLEKPCTAQALIPVLKRALEKRALVLENRRLKAQLETGDPPARMVFGISPQAEALRARVRAVAPVAAEVLVHGPPGAGVSKVAEVIHLTGPRAAGPFVKRVSAGLSVAALEAALEAAEGGSLYLDEVSALSPDMHHALLDQMDKHASVRLIAGSTRDLEALSQNGAFLPELYFRLEGMAVRIPAISERPEDIPVLFRHYVAQAAEQAGLPAPEIASEHLSALMAQDWPGNARSLMSAAMRFVLGMPEEAQEAGALGLADQMARVERSLLVAALGRQNGNASDAAKALKLPRKTFYDKLKKYGIRAEDYRR